MRENKKTIEIAGQKFEVPQFELYCEKCETTNFIYADMKPPYKCDNCGAVLEIDESEAQYEHDEGRYDSEQ